MRLMHEECNLRCQLTVSLFFGIICSAGLAAEPVAQPRGYQLFELMGSSSLARTTGTTSVRWLPKGLGYLEKGVDSASGKRTFYRVDPEEGRRRPLFDEATLTRIGTAFNELTGVAVSGIPFRDFEFASNGEALRFERDGKKFVYWLERQRMLQLQIPDVPPLALTLQAEGGTLSPDFETFIYIKDNDLHQVDARTGHQTPLTSAGQEAVTIGFLGSGDGFVTSPDSKKTAYIRADQRTSFRYPVADLGEMKEELEYVRYPFVGEPNPKITLHVVDLKSHERHTIADNKTGNGYIRDIVWRPDASEIFFQQVNRQLNRLQLKAAHPNTGEVRTVLVEEEQTFLDSPFNFRFIERGQHFLWSSERSGWRHLYVYDLEGNVVRQLTSGGWEVGEILHIVEQQQWIYFYGFTNRGLDRHLFRIKFGGTDLSRLTQSPGVHTISIDPAGSYYLDDFSSLESPRSVAIHQIDGRFIRSVASTNIDRVQDLGLRAPELRTIKAADGKTLLSGLMFKPVDFDPQKRYPLLVHVYGGTHSKENWNAYQTTAYLAREAQLGFIVWQLDARGTPFRGKAFQSANYLKLGQCEVDDQAEAVRQLSELPYIDGSRVGVTGLSHGGYMTLMMLLRHPEVFHVGVAGAPLTDLRFGPAQYIERVMRLPQENPEGYLQGSPTTHAKNLKGKLLVYHGTNDHNALLLNTTQFVQKLINAQRPVDMMIYPSGVHVLRGNNALHQYKTQISYFLTHLQPEGWAEALESVWSK